MTEVNRWPQVPGGTVVVAARDYDALVAELAEARGEVSLVLARHDTALRAYIRKLETALTSIVASPADGPAIWLDVVRGCFESETGEKQ